LVDYQRLTKVFAPSGTQNAPSGTQNAPSGTQNAPSGTQVFIYHFL